MKRIRIRQYIETATVWWTVITNTCQELYGGVRFLIITWGLFWLY